MRPSDIRIRVEFNVEGGPECLIRYDGGPIPRINEHVFWKGVTYVVVDVRHEPASGPLHLDAAGCSEYGHVVVTMRAEP